MGESVREALDELPEIYREALTLHYFGGMSIKDIARAIGASPTAVGVRLSRGRAQLKEEMIAIMNTTFEGQRLQAGFTFRVVEAVKRMKINPMPRMAGLPLGLSLAMGIIITVLSLSPHISIPSDMLIPAGSPLPLEAKVLKAGEIPVDLLETSQISLMASKQGYGHGSKPKLPHQQVALFMAPQAEGDKWTDKAGMPTPRLSFGSAVVGGKLYAIGGQGEFNNLWC